MIFQDPYASLEPPDDGRRHHRRAARQLQGPAAARPSDAPGPGAAASRGPRPRLQQPLPARVQRRPAPAHRHRPGPGAQPRADRLRRAGLAPWTSRSRPRSSTCSRSCRREFGLTYLFIAHDLSVVRHISRPVAVMYLGKIVEIARSDDLYAHPSTPTPRRCSPPCRSPTRAAESRRRLVVLTGEVPVAAPPALGLPLPHALPHRAGPGDLQRRGAAARGEGRRASRRLSPLDTGRSCAGLNPGWRTPRSRPRAVQ